MEFPGTLQAIAASVAGGFGLLWWWLKGAPKRREEKFHRKLQELDAKSDLAKREGNEGEYNRLLAERRLLLDDWLR